MGLEKRNNLRCVNIKTLQKEERTLTCTGSLTMILYISSGD